MLDTRPTNAEKPHALAWGSFGPERNSNVTTKPTKLQGSDPPQYAYYAAGNNFGHFVGLMDQFGTGVFTVNYGSNLAFLRIRLPIW